MDRRYASPAERLAHSQQSEYWDTLKDLEEGLWQCVTTDLDPKHESTGYLPHLAFGLSEKLRCLVSVRVSSHYLSLSSLGRVDVRRGLGYGEATLARLLLTG